MLLCASCSCVIDACAWLPVLLSGGRCFVLCGWLDFEQPLFANALSSSSMDLLGVTETPRTKKYCGHNGDEIGQV